MDFNAHEMREAALIKEGRYKFIVRDAREKRSTSGNDMINLKLVLDVNGKLIQYYDSLILIPKMFWKVEHFCKTCHMAEKIDQGRLMAQDCLGKEGYIDIIQKVDARTGELDNQTRDYVKPEDMIQTEVPQEPAFNDDIPFN